jgi:predicted nucleic acid-binding protein
MGGVAALHGKRVYFDANVFIYAVEQSPEHAAFLDELFTLLEAGEIVAVTSELTLAEVLAKPLEAQRPDLAQLYEAMIAPSDWLTVVPVERIVLVEAARLRVPLGLKLPDAIHVASAVAARCDVLLSNDRRLRVPAGLPRLGLD